MVISKSCILVAAILASWFSWLFHDPDDDRTRNERYLVVYQTVSEKDSLLISLDENGTPSRGDFQATFRRVAFKGIVQENDTDGVCLFYEAHGRDTDNKDADVLSSGMEADHEQIDRIFSIRCSQKSNSLLRITLKSGEQFVLSGHPQDNPEENSEDGSTPEYWSFVVDHVVTAPSGTVFKKA